MGLAEELGKALYDLEPNEAVEQNICIRCKKPPQFKTKAGQREYEISGYCEYCFDELFEEF